MREGSDRRGNDIRLLLENMKNWIERTLQPFVGVDMRLHFKISKNTTIDMQ